MANGNEPHPQVLKSWFNVKNGIIRGLSRKMTKWGAHCLSLFIFFLDFCHGEMAKKIVIFAIDFHHSRHRFSRRFRHRFARHFRHYFSAFSQFRHVLFFPKNRWRKWRWSPNIFSNFNSVLLQRHHLGAIFFANYAIPHPPKKANYAARCGKFYRIMR